MAWTVIFTADFHLWIDAQPVALRNKISAELLNIGFWGPYLGRPLVDTVKGSRYPNMKELRMTWNGDPYRIFFAFDPQRQALVLCAGNKSGRKRFYETLIRQADALFTLHLADLEKENDNLK